MKKNTWGEPEVKLLNDKVEDWYRYKSKNNNNGTWNRAGEERAKTNLHRVTMMTTMIKSWLQWL